MPSCISRSTTRSQTFENNQTKDGDTVQAIGAVLAGTNKPFLVSSASPIAASARTGEFITEDTVAHIEGPAAGRATTEKVALGLAQKGVHSAMVRFLPTVYGGPLPHFAFVLQLTASAKKHGFAAYIGDGLPR
jgi:hypothetical protein